MRWVRDLNTLYRSNAALWNDDQDGWAWIAEHTETSVLAYQRMNGGRTIVVVLNLTPTPRENYRVGVPEAGQYRELLNGDASIYGGSGMGNLGLVESTPIPYHDRFASIVLTLPPLAMLVFEKTS